MIAIVDYGLGNLFSVKNALAYIGAESEITADAQAIKRADGVILPGVGAFGKGMEMLSQTGLAKCLQQQDKPLLGICLGMQFLFDKSYEFGAHSGLSLIDGEVVKMEVPLKIPHMGWNGLHICRWHELLDGIDEGAQFYFVHSFMAVTPQENLLATCDYGGPVTALVQKGNVFGAQFHPEKSGEAGLRLLTNFWRMTR